MKFAAALLLALAITTESATAMQLAGEPSAPEAVDNSAENSDDEAEEGQSLADAKPKKAKKAKKGKKAGKKGGKKAGKKGDDGPVQIAKGYDAPEQVSVPDPKLPKF